FLAELMGDFGEPILAIPGYNAGGGAISRWLKENPGVPADEFVESIGAQETRDYARKVFESYAAYRYLYGEGDARFAPLRFAVAGKAQSKPAAAKPATGHAKKAPAKPPKKPAAKKKSPPRGERR
ncbi:MAG: hypothetical protein FJ087_20185, partial [Deltaproteobacteria bacterium]|nr:hypothetical protein [Deltaproteobacteria bacterium]